MTTINYKQQELIDDSVNEYIKSYDKLATQYLNIRKQIIALSSSISSKENISSTDGISIQKLKAELDIIWKGYMSHLNMIEKKLQVSKEIQPPYLDDLKAKYEKLLVKRLTITKNLKNIKDVQLPLIEKMKQLNIKYTRSLNKSTAKKYFRKEHVQRDISAPQNDLIDVSSLIYSKSKIQSLFEDFEVKVNRLKTIHDVDGADSKGHPIKASYYIEKELETGDKYMPLDNDEFLFNISKINYQDNYLANASVESYDKLNDKLTNEIIDLINKSTSAKEKWDENARKIEKFKTIISGNEDIVMKD